MSQQLLSTHDVITCNLSENKNRFQIILICISFYLYRKDPKCVRKTFPTNYFSKRGITFFYYFFSNVLLIWSELCLKSKKMCRFQYRNYEYNKQVIKTHRQFFNLDHKILDVVRLPFKVDSLLHMSQMSNKEYTYNKKILTNLRKSEHIFI